jgi:hypothetical protein
MRFRITRCIPPPRRWTAVRFCGCKTPGPVDRGDLPFRKMAPILDSRIYRPLIPAHEKLPVAGPPAPAAKV